MHFLLIIKKKIVYICRLRIKKNIFLLFGKQLDIVVTYYKYLMKKKMEKKSQKKINFTILNNEKFVITF